MPLPLLLASCSSLFAPAATPSPSAVNVVHHPTQLTSAQRFATRSSEQGLLASWIGPWGAWFSPAAPITIETRDCGRAEAMYDPSLDTVIVCHELVVAFDRFFRSRTTDRDAHDRRVDAALQWAVLHELGHAMVDRLQLTMRREHEEHVADEFASLVLLEQSRVAPVILTALWLSAAAARGHDPAATGKPHSGPADRSVRLRCLLRGSRSSRHDPAPPTSCAAEYRRARREWEHRLRGDQSQ